MVIQNLLYFLEGNQALYIVYIMKFHTKKKDQRILKGMNEHCFESALGPGLCLNASLTQ
jgi:hypothetical protein